MLVNQTKHSARTIFESKRWRDLYIWFDTAVPRLSNPSIIQYEQKKCAHCLSPAPHYVVSCNYWNRQPFLTQERSTVTCFVILLLVLSQSSFTSRTVSPNTKPHARTLIALPLTTREVQPPHKRNARLSTSDLYAYFGTNTDHIVFFFFKRFANQSPNGRTYN